MSFRSIHLVSKSLSLICRLLERDPEQRIPIQGALNSPWMHKLTAPSSQPLNLLVVDRLQAFAGFTDLQRILLNLCVVCQPASRKHLQRLFDDLVCIQKLLSEIALL